MAINFPSNPNNGDTISVGNKTYTFDSASGVWDIDSPAPGASTTVYADMAALIAATGMSNGDQAFVTGNNNLYIYSGSGWYKVATVQNDSPSAITGVDGSYVLAVDGTATTITAVSTDPEGFPLTWSYATSGLGNIATISQSDNVFTITPSTTEANAGTFTLTINATDGVNGAVSTTTNLTLEFIVIVTNSRYTTLLATAVDTSDNNNITDSSTNNHTITVAGDAYAGTFSPYRHVGYSTYFDGTGGKWFNFPTSTDFNLTDQSFHISFWCYPEALGDYDTIIAQMGTMAIEVVSNSMRMWLSTGTAASWDLLNAAQISNTLNLNEWAYITVVRDTDNNTLKSYHNGTLVYNNTSFTGTVGNSTNTMDIGKYNNSSANTWNGYIRDLRYRVGTNSENTSNSVPTEPVTSEDSLTKLLTCHSPFISDGSSNSRSVTIVGNPATEPFTPYDNVEHSATDHGGSVYHSGAGHNYLSLPSTPTIGTSDFEISMWLYPETKSGDDVIIDFRPTSTNGSYINFLLTGGVPILNVNGSAITGTTELPIKSWSYLTLTRVSGSTKLYVNGTQTGSTYSDTNDYLTGSNRPVIAQAGYTTSSTLGFNGYMSDLIIKLSGNSSPSVPTAPVSSSGTSLHIKGTDASIIDKSQTGNIKVFGTATGSSTEVKFANTKSMYFPGTNSHHMTHYNSFNLPGELTIECWVNPSTFNSGYVWCLENYQLEMRINSNGTGVDVYDSGYINFTRAAGAMSTGTWYHIAVCRDSSNVFRVWIDGVRSSESGTKTTTYDKDHIVIGGEYASATTTNWPYHGYVQDLRISNYARYSAADETANIPTEPLKG